MSYHLRTTLARRPLAGTWTDNAVKAMTENPEYFAWWYTVKSVGLGVACAALAYFIGRDMGRRQRGGA